MARVLIVDDMEIVRFQVSKVCQRLGFSDILVAMNGEDAWNRIQDKKEIDVIISDYNMPKMNGEELLSKLRADKQYNHIQFIFLTSESEKSKINALMNQGVDHFILKPFSLDSLESELRGRLSLSNQVINS